MQCWVDEIVDPNRIINRIINGLFYHPSQDMMGDDGAADCRRLIFGVPEKWWVQWISRKELRRKLSRDGVLNLENHHRRCPWIREADGLVRCIATDTLPITTILLPQQYKS
jgi:hypothetical protein